MKKNYDISGEYDAESFRKEYKKFYNGKAMISPTITRNVGENISDFEIVHRPTGIQYHGCFIVLQLLYRDKEGKLVDSDQYDLEYIIDLDITKNPIE